MTCKLSARRQSDFDASSTPILPIFGLCQCHDIRPPAYDSLPARLTPRQSPPRRANLEHNHHLLIYKPLPPSPPGHSSSIL